MASGTPRRSPRKSPQKSTFEEEVPFLKGEASSAKSARGKPLTLRRGPRSPLKPRTSESDESNESDDSCESCRNAKPPEVKYYPYLYENDYPLPTIEYNDLPPFDSTPVTPLNLQSHSTNTLMIVLATTMTTSTDWLIQCQTMEFIWEN